MRLHVDSEVGTLRQAILHRPGLELKRLTPTNKDDYLFDDVLWVENAKRDHFDFIQKLRDRGVDVVEMHNLLAETVAVPEGKKWILDNQITANEVGISLMAPHVRYPDHRHPPEEVYVSLAGGASTTFQVTVRPPEG